MTTYLGVKPGEILIFMASETIYKTKIRVVDKPRSKWPYWIYCSFPNDNTYYWTNFWKHDNLKNILIENKVDVVIENRYRKILFTTFSVEKVHKSRSGTLYKFRKSDDRLMFIMENSNVLETLS
jgi:hypothetical protein